MIFNGFFAGKVEKKFLMREDLLNFASILKTRHPKVDNTFEIALQTTLIKGKFGQLWTKIQNPPNFIK
jgi:hypothetical protein